MSQHHSMKSCRDIKFLGLLSRHKILCRDTKILALGHTLSRHKILCLDMKPFCLGQTLSRHKISCPRPSPFATPNLLPWSSRLRQGNLCHNKELKPLLQQRKSCCDIFYSLKSKNHVATQEFLLRHRTRKNSVTTRNPLSRPKTSSSLSWHFLHSIATKNPLSRPKHTIAYFFGISYTSNSLPMHLIQYYCLYTYYIGSMKSGKTFQHNIEQV